MSSNYLKFLFVQQNSWQARHRVFPNFRLTSNNYDNNYDNKNNYDNNNNSDDNNKNNIETDDDPKNSKQQSCETGCCSNCFGVGHH